MINKDTKFYLIGGEYESYYSSNRSYFYNVISKDFFDSLNLTEKIEEEILDNEGDTGLVMYVGELDGKHSDCEADLTFSKISFDKAIKMINDKIIKDYQDVNEVYEAFCDWIKNNSLEENIDDFWTKWKKDYNTTYEELSNYIKENIVKIDETITKDELNNGKMLEDKFIISFESKSELKDKLTELIKTL